MERVRKGWHGQGSRQQIKRHEFGFPSAPARGLSSMTSARAGLFVPQEAERMGTVVPVPEATCACPCHPTLDT
jgi:hypothetical protein